MVQKDPVFWAKSQPSQWERNTGSKVFLLLLLSHWSHAALAKSTNGNSLNFKIIYYKG